MASVDPNSSSSAPKSPIKFFSKAINAIGRLFSIGSGSGSKAKVNDAISDLFEDVKDVTSKVKQEKSQTPVINASANSDIIQQEKPKIQVVVTKTAPWQPASPPSKITNEAPVYGPANFNETLNNERDFQNAQELHAQVLQQFTDLVYGNEEKQIPPQESLRRLIIADRSGAIGLSGLSILIDHVKQLPAGKDFNCFVCRNEDISATIDKINKSNFEGKIALLTQNKWGHVTPILIERNKEAEGKFKLKICIMDSTAAVGNYSARVLHSLPPLSPDDEIYIPVQGRQNDKTSCPVFSLSDARHFFKNDKFFEELNAYGEIQKAKMFGKPYRAIHNLPPESMKLTQSMSQLDKYMRGIDETENSGEWNTKSLREKMAKSYTRVATVEKQVGYDKTTVQKTINMKAADRQAKYLHVITCYITGRKPEEVEGIAKKYDLSKLEEFLSSYSATQKKDQK